jgi:DNA-binding protein Alba
MPARFEVYKDAAGKFRFRLNAENNRIVAASEAYEQHASCIKGVRSVQKNCSAEIEDMTIEGKRISNPKYQVFCDENAKFRFHLNASNGEIIAQSEGYETKEGCMKGIEAFRTSCNGEIEDLTITQEPTQQETKAQLPSTAVTTEAEDLTKEQKTAPIEMKVSQSVRAPGKIVFVGNKMPMDYVMAIITGFSGSKVEEIILKARGQAITTAVDAAEITRNRFLRDLRIGKIIIGTEKMPPREGETRARMVSTIEIVLTRG